MAVKNGTTVAVYVTAENAARVDYAKKLELNVSKIINDILDKHFKPALEKAKAEKVKGLRELADAPVP